MADGPTTTIALDPDLRDRLGKLADARGRTADHLMRDAIAEYVGRQEARDRLRDDALAALADYRATGLHATGEEVDAWLARLENGEDADPPTCHR